METLDKTIEAVYTDPIFQKAIKNLTEDDIQFFKDLQAGKIDLKNKKELKRRSKDIELRMVANFNKYEIIRFIKVMHIITKLNQRNKFIKMRLSKENKENG